MKLPLLGDKTGAKSRVEPEEHFSYLIERGKGLQKIPDLGVILFFQSGVLGAIKARHSLEVVDPFRPKMHLLKTPEGTVGLVSDFGMGGPAATVLMEILIAAGVKRFVFIGSAGALQPNLGAGDLVLCEEAVRDEGVSYHYVSADQDVKATSKLLKGWEDALEENGRECHVGLSWTTDAPFRETHEHVETFRSQGVLCVEMEAASVYAVAKHRGVDIASGFAISDSLSDGGWKPQFHYTATKEAQIDLFEAAVRALRGI